MLAKGSDGAPPPDELEYMTAWVAFLEAHARVVPRVSRDLESSNGISLAWWDMIFQLSLVRDRRLRMHELAEALLLTRGGLTKLTDRLERAGLVAREAIPGDRRSFYVKLTPKGADLVRKGRRFVARSVKEHFAKHLSAHELTTLRATLERLAAAQRKMTRHGATGAKRSG